MAGRDHERRSRGADRAPRRVSRLCPRSSGSRGGSARSGTATLRRSRARPRLRVGRSAAAARLRGRPGGGAHGEDSPHQPLRLGVGHARAARAGKGRIGARAIVTSRRGARERRCHTAVLSRLSTYARPAHRPPHSAAVARGSSRAHTHGTHACAIPLFHPVEGLAERRYAVRRAFARSRALRPAPLSSLLPPRALFWRVEPATRGAGRRRSGLRRDPIPQRRSVRALRAGAAARPGRLEQHRVARRVRRVVRAISLLGPRA